MTILNLLVEKWVKILNLEHSFDYDVHIGFTEGQSFCGFRDTYFVIGINKDTPYKEQTIAHELGHLYLAKLYNDFGLIKHNGKVPKSKTDLEILGYSKALIDPFVNYHLSKFKEYPFLLLNTLKGYSTNSVEFQKDFTLQDYLMLYMDIYVEYYHVLKPTKDITFKQSMKTTHNNLRKAILDSCPRERKFTLKKIQDLDRELNTFRKIKDIMNSQTIIDFTKRVIDALGFFDKEHIEHYINLRYRYIPM